MAGKVTKNEILDFKLHESYSNGAHLYLVTPVYEVIDHSTKLSTITIPFIYHLLVLPKALDRCATHDYITMGILMAVTYSNREITCMRIKPTLLLIF